MVRINIREVKMDANLDQFLEQLLIEKGITDLDDDVRAEVKANMAERILDQIDQACINALSEEKAFSSSNS